MAKKTLKERYLAALVARGERVIDGDPGRRHMVVSFTYQIRRAADGSLIEREKPTRIYLGDAGSVRIGKTVSGSIAMQPGLKQLLLEEVK